MEKEQPFEKSKNGTSWYHNASSFLCWMSGNALTKNHTHFTHTHTNMSSSSASTSSVCVISGNSNWNCAYTSQYASFQPKITHAMTALSIF